MMRDCKIQSITKKENHLFYGTYSVSLLSNYDSKNDQDGKICLSQLIFQKSIVLTIQTLLLHLKMFQSNLDKINSFLFQDLQVVVKPHSSILLAVLTAIILATLKLKEFLQRNTMTQTGIHIAISVLVLFSNHTTLSPT